MEQTTAEDRVPPLETAEEGVLQARVREVTDSNWGGGAPPSNPMKELEVPATSSTRPEPSTSGQGLDLEEPKHSDAPAQALSPGH